MSGILGQFSLVDEIDHFAAEYSSGRYAKTLLKTPHLRIVLIGMEAGTELNEHSAPGPITIQPIRGRFTVIVDGSEHILVAETVIAIDESVRHAVRADEDCVFLLTIAWRGDANHISDENR